MKCNDPLENNFFDISYNKLKQCPKSPNLYLMAYIVFSKGGDENPRLKGIPRRSSLRAAKEALKAFRGSAFDPARNERAIGKRNRLSQSDF